MALRHGWWSAGLPPHGLRGLRVPGAVWDDLREMGASAKRQSFRVQREVGFVMFHER